MTWLWIIIALVVCVGAWFLMKGKKKGGAPKMEEPKSEEPMNPEA